MAQLPVSVNINGQTYTGTVEVPTVRIPELTEKILPYDQNDLLPLYDYSRNKTVHTPVETFREYLILGGNEAGQTPILSGDILEIPITSAMAGSNRVIVPQLANKTYTLYRRGIGELKVSEFNVLPSGGFELKDRDENDEPVTAGTGTADLVRLGETFFARIYELAYNPVSLTGTSSQFNGIAPVSESIALNTVHYNKLLNVIGGDNKVTITLQDVSEAYQKNAVIEIATNITNKNQTRIVAKSGQSIYYGNTAQTDIYLGISEYVRLLAGADGWYMLPGASEGILNVGQPLLDYTQRLNTVVAIGQTANRADYPRLVKWLSTIGQSWVDDTTWLSSQLRETGSTEVYNPFKGFFSKGDGTNTFRFPDLQDLAFASLKNIAFYDGDRVSNYPGGIQPDMIRSHQHPNKDAYYSEFNGNGPVVGIGSDGSDNDNRLFIRDTNTELYGQSKTVMKNAGFLPLIRV